MFEHDIDAFFGGDFANRALKSIGAVIDHVVGSGRVRNLLAPADGPDDAEETVEIRARTAYGDVVIRRA